VRTPHSPSRIASSCKVALERSDASRTVLVAELETVGADAVRESLDYLRRRADELVVSH
jgi:hypothetical protein